MTNFQITNFTNNTEGDRYPKINSNGDVVWQGTRTETGVIIVYSKNSGGLYYNQNGAIAGLGTGAEFATLTTKPTLVAANFAIVS